MTDQPLIRPPVGVSVAAGASGTVTSTDEGETTGLDVYLVAIGTGIDPVSNDDYATFRLLVNGGRHPVFGAMTSQIGSTTLPQRFAQPLYLGRGVKVALYGEMGSGATGATNMFGTFELRLKMPTGER